MWKEREKIQEKRGHFPTSRGKIFISKTGQSLFESPVATIQKSNTHPKCKIKLLKQSQSLRKERTENKVCKLELTSLHITVHEARSVFYPHVRKPDKDQVLEFESLLSRYCETAAAVSKTLRVLPILTHSLAGYSIA